MTVHDFTRPHRCWGHDIAYTVKEDGQRLEGSLWTSQARLATGDQLILTNGEATTRYLVTCVRWCRDPDDMYFFVAVFDPRKEDEWGTSTT